MVQKSLFFQCTSCTLCEAAPAASTPLKMPQATASSIHPGAPLPQFPGSLAVCLQKMRQNLVSRLSALLHLTDLAHQQKPCSYWRGRILLWRVTQERGNVINIIFSCIQSISFFFSLFAWLDPSPPPCYASMLGWAEHPWGSGRCQLMVNPFSRKDSLALPWPWQSLLHWWYFLSIPVFFVSNRGQVLTLGKVIATSTGGSGDDRWCNVGHRKLRKSYSACSHGPFAAPGLA